MTKGKTNFGRLKNPSQPDSDGYFRVIIFSKLRSLLNHLSTLIRLTIRYLEKKIGLEINFQIPMYTFLSIISGLTLKSDKKISTDLSIFITMLQTG